MANQSTILPSIERMSPASNFLTSKISSVGGSLM